MNLVTHFVMMQWWKFYLLEIKLEEVNHILLIERITSQSIGTIMRIFVHTNERKTKKRTKNAV